MNIRHTAFTVLLLFGLAHPALARQGQQASAQPANIQPAEARPVTAQPPNVNVSRLPIDLQRIQRELAQRTREREQRDGLNLRYVVDVFGQAPPIELFTPEDNLLNGPVPYGAPTHREMIYMVTPEEFRSPVMDFNSLFRWLSNKSRK